MDSELAGGRGKLSLSESFNIGRDGGSNNAARPLFYTELLESVCPDYIAMGMSYDEFWNGPNDAPRMYMKAHVKKREMANEEAWMHGLYVQNAIAACFSGKKNPFKYPEKPFGFNSEQKEKTEAISEDDKHEQADSKAKQLMEIWAINFNQKFEERQRKKSDGKEVSENA